MNRKNSGDETMCLVCDLWWLWLLIFLSLVAAILLRDYWMPYVFPKPSPIPTVTPSMEITPIATVAMPTPTIQAMPTMGTGDVQATLRWNNLNDLDLHVVDPAGNEIYYGHNSSPTGGLLDVDNNAGCGDRVTSRPVENIYWPVGVAPTGEYRVFVNLYKRCDPDTTSSVFSVTVIVDGVTKTFSGEVSESDPVAQVYRFTR